MGKICRIPILGHVESATNCDCRFDRKSDREIKPPSKQRVLTHQIRGVSRVIVIVDWVQTFKIGKSGNGHVAHSRM